MALPSGPRPLAGILLDPHLGAEPMLLAHEPDEQKAHADGRHREEILAQAHGRKADDETEQAGNHDAGEQRQPAPNSRPPRTRRPHRRRRRRTRRDPRLNCPQKPLIRLRLTASMMLMPTIDSRL